MITGSKHTGLAQILMLICSQPAEAHDATRGSTHCVSSNNSHGVAGDQAHELSSDAPHVYAATQVLPGTCQLPCAAQRHALADIHICSKLPPVRVCIVTASPRRSSCRAADTLTPWQQSSTKYHGCDHIQQMLRCTKVQCCSATCHSSCSACKVQSTLWAWVLVQHRAWVAKQRQCAESCNGTAAAVKHSKASHGRRLQATQKWSGQ